MEFQTGDLVEVTWLHDWDKARGPAIVMKVWSHNGIQVNIQVWIPALGASRLINHYWMRRLTPRQEDNNEVSKG